MKKEPTLINIETGEVVNDRSGVQDLSDARKAVLIKIKELEAIQKGIDKLLQPYVEKAAEEGEDRLCDYWSIVTTNRFNTSLFKKAASPSQLRRYNELDEELKSIKDNPDYFKSSSYLKFPKIS